MGAFSDVVDLALIARQQVRDLSDQGHKFHGWFNPFPNDMAGSCGVVCLHTVNMALKRGYHPTFVRGDYHWMGHCWIEYYNHIIDPTATQFIYNASAVHIVNKRAVATKPSDYWHTAKHRISSEKDIEDIEKKIAGWTTYLPVLKQLSL